MTNTKPMRSKNGISYSPDALFKTEKPVELKNDRSAICGKNLNRTDKINPPIVANKAAFEVVFFQKNPKMNMAKIPGETNPVYS